jgi:hypothetical protein
MAHGEAFIFNFFGIGLHIFNKFKRTGRVKHNIGILNVIQNSGETFTKKDRFNLQWETDCEFLQSEDLKGCCMPDSYRFCRSRMKRR